MPDPHTAGTKRTIHAESEVVVKDGKRLLLVGECKWQKEPADLKTLAQLERIARHIPGYHERATRVAIFSRAGFTTDLRDRSGSRPIVLRSVEELYGADDRWPSTS